MKQFIAIFTLFFIFSIQQTAFTQNKYLEEVEANLGLGIASKNDNFVGNLSINRIHKLPIYKDLIKVGLGYGLRYTANFAQNATLDASDRDLPINTSFLLSDVQTHAMNLNIYAQLSIWRIDIGANIDVLGFSFGSSQNGVLVAEGQDILANNASAKPTPFNILQGFPQDEGNLQSQRFYIRYWINEKMAVRVGLAHTFAEYELDQSVDNVSERFRNTTSPLMIGFTYKFWKSSK